MTADLPDRFWAKVEKTDTCWLWTAATRKTDGYGVFGWTARDIRPAHKVSWEAEHGPVPDGLVLDHLCRVRNCVRPSHLEPKTDRANILAGVGPTAVNAAKTHCIRGHEFTPENTRIDQGRYGPQRQCRTCWKERRRARRSAAA